jgi:thymidylate synthase ThyX
LTIDAQVICDSVGEHSPRLTTFFGTFHKFVLAERNRHRMLSLSDRSSRAVPTSILLKEVLVDPAMPVQFKSKASGMGGGVPLIGDALVRARNRWRTHSRMAVSLAQEALDDGENKETANRHLDQFVYTHSVMTGIEDGWLNFFGLRLDKAAQPEIRVLAEAMWKAWNDSEPKNLVSGEWHLPFIDDQTSDLITCAGIAEHARIGETPDPWVLSTKISAARCARTSYLSFDTGRRSTIKEDDALANRLIEQKHWSPFEHQATPDKLMIWLQDVLGWAESETLELPRYQKQYQAGNLGPGWRQFRKMHPGESVAPLPEEYR